MKTRTVVKISDTRHKQSFLSTIHGLWNNSCYSNAVLVGKSHSGSPRFTPILVNKSILAAVSHKLAALLINTEDDVNLVFPDTDCMILQFFVSFIYSGEIILNTVDYQNMASDLKSFFSDWGVYFPEIILEKNPIPNSFCKNVTQQYGNISKDNNGSSSTCFSRDELSVCATEAPLFSKLSEDGPANFEKLFHRTYTRKNKKPEKLVKTFSTITPHSSVLNHDYAIDLKDESQLTSDDSLHVIKNKRCYLEEQETTLNHSKELWQELDETTTPDNCNHNKTSEDEEEKKTKQNSLLDILTEEVDRYKTCAKHLSSDRDIAKTPAKPKRLPCSICGKEISADYMTDHVKLHAQDRSYLCELCGASFVLADRLRKHMKFTHGDKSQLQSHTCKVCGKSFNKAKNLKLHETLHLGLKPFRCPYCDKSFRLYTAFQKHKRIHTGEKPYECSVCHKCFSARSNYVVHFRRHQKTSTSGEASSCFDAQASLYKCSTCGVAFRRENPFLIHVAAHRGEEPKLPCKHCSETFPTYKLLKKHKIEKHADALFKCDECSALFSTSTALKNHAITHKEGKCPRCLLCNRYFRTPDELKAHQRNSHANVQLACNVCGKSFKSFLSLRVHSRVHSGERPYQCSYCPKAFRQETHLANHVRTHTGEKPFLCAVCGKAFNLKNNLSVHMKIHTGEKIQCETCGKTFRSFVKLKEHESAHLVAEEQPTHFSSMSDNLQCQK